MTVTQTDIEAILGRDLTAAEETRVARLTEMAEAQVESMLPGFSIATGTATDEDVPYNDPDLLWTARYPVTAVSAVKINGSTVDSDGYRWSTFGKLELTLGRQDDFEINVASLAAFPTVTVTYTYGQSPVAADIAAAVAAGVAAVLRRQAANPDGVQSESLGAYQVSYGDAASKAAMSGVVPPESELLRRWKRNRQVSVPLLRYR